MLTTVSDQTTIEIVRVRNIDKLSLSGLNDSSSFNSDIISVYFDGVSDIKLENSITVVFKHLKVS